MNNEGLKVEVLTDANSDIISISGPPTSYDIEIDSNSSLYYSNLAKSWATKLNETIDGKEYSAKYYAQKAQICESAANTAATNTERIYRDVISFSDEIKRELNNFQTDSINNIQTLQNTAIEDIEAKKNEGIQELETIVYRNGIILDSALNKAQTTNCITETPQRIKYTLVDGTLTIKAGSVVIVPYGNEDLTAQHPIGTTFLNDNFKVVDTQFADGKFFVWAEVQVDIVSNFTWNGTYTNNFAYIDINNNELFFKRIEVSLSGNIWSGSFTALNAWYNTTSNTVKEHQADGIVTREISSLPLLTFDNQVSAITSINQVFNGMGYIGSTVWVDKGVKGLIPNGRNEDGTLNNIEYASDRIFMRTFNSTVADSNLEELIFCPFDSSFPYFTGSAIKGNYITNDGFLYNKNTDSILKGFSICFLSRRSGKVTEMIPKQPFRAIDYSDKSEVSGWSMPSNKPIELSWGAFGTEYTAPCNGFFEAGGRINNNGYIALWNKTINLGGKSCSSLDNFLLNAWIFANKGDVVQLQYVNYMSDGGVRFFPCVGCEREV